MKYFLGSKIFENISLHDILPYLNLELLFKQQWGFDESSLPHAEKILADFIDLNKQENIIRPKAIFGFYLCRFVNQKLEIYADAKTQKKLCEFDFVINKNSLAKYFQPNKIDYVAFQIVTIGIESSTYAKKLFQNHEYQKYHLWHGFNVRLTEALAEFVHKHIETERNLANKCCRFSPGYPIFPELEANEKILKLLAADRIGISLTESYQFIPVESTAAIVIKPKNCS